MINWLKLKECPILMGFCSLIDFSTCYKFGILQCSSENEKLAFIYILLLLISICISCYISFHISQKLKYYLINLYSKLYLIFYNYKYPIQINTKFDDKCCICITKINESTNVRILRCNHKYCAVCIDDWIKHKNICPICRQKII
jgi:hypothetical protein